MYTYGSMPRTFYKLDRITDWSYSGSDLVHTILFADSVYYGSTASDHGKQIFQILEAGHANASAFSIHVRHSGMANCLMGDGHVESLSKAELQSPAYELVNLSSPDYVAVYP